MDIDFDALDAAVVSAMNNKKASRPSKPLVKQPPLVTGSVVTVKTPIEKPKRRANLTTARSVVKTRRTIKTNRSSPKPTVNQIIRSRPSTIGRQAPSKTSSTISTSANQQHSRLVQDIIKSITKKDTPTTSKTALKSAGITKTEVTLIKKSNNNVETITSISDITVKQNLKPVAKVVTSKIGIETSNKPITPTASILETQQVGSKRSELLRQKRRLRRNQSSLRPLTNPVNQSTPVTSPVQSSKQSKIINLDKKITTINSLAKNSTIEESELVQTPFLSNPNVKKRPLGSIVKKDDLINDQLINLDLNQTKTEAKKSLLYRNDAKISTDEVDQDISLWLKFVIVFSIALIGVTIYLLYLYNK